jgi:hypothetical protein
MINLLGTKSGGDISSGTRDRGLESGTGAGGFSGDGSGGIKAEMN